MGVRDFIESKLTVTHAMLVALYALLGFDILDRSGPVLGTYVVDLLAMVLFSLVLYINRKLDKKIEQVRTEAKLESERQDRFLQLSFARLNAGLDDFTGEPIGKHKEEPGEDAEEVQGLTPRSDLSDSTWPP